MKINPFKVIGQRKQRELTKKWVEFNNPKVTRNDKLAQEHYESTQTNKYSNPIINELVEGDNTNADGNGLWVCGTCHTPQTFDNRESYISHHYIHHS